MRERRIYEGTELVYDARETLDKRKHKGEILLKIINGPLSFETPNGVIFYSKHPFQWVAEEEANLLLALRATKFTEATVEQLEDWYSF